MDANGSDAIRIVVPPDARDRIETLWKRTIQPGMTITATLKLERCGAASHRSLDPHPAQVVAFNGATQPPPHYILLKRLGSGGMGDVYEARQTSLSRSVALKMIKPAQADDEQHRKEFLSEAAVTGDLNHPNIPPVHDLAANTAGQLFLCMKKVEGKRWKDVLRDNPLRENLRVLLDICDAVAFAHSRGIIHRDLKPENVMLGEFGEVYLMDWGLAASVRGEARGDPLAPGMAFGGTPAYMAPEMARGDAAAIGIASDIYLLGAILYQIVAGHPPHAGASMEVCLANALGNRIEPTQETGELVDIALKAMATDTAQRYPDCKSFQQAVRAYLEHAESLALTTQAEETARRAAAARKYEGFTEAAVDFRQALKLWPQNARASEGLSRTRLAHAECALTHEDLDLAAGLLDETDPRHAALRARVRSALAAREAGTQRARRLRWAAAAAALACLGFIAYFGYDAFRYFGKWHVVYREDFTKPRTDLGRLLFSDTSEWDVAPGMIGPNGLRLSTTHGFWLRKTNVRGDVRVEVRMKWPSRVDGLDILLNARPERGPPMWMARPGYLCQFGAYGGAINFVSRNEKTEPPDTSCAVPASFESGRVYDLVFEHVGDELAIYVDGHQVLRRPELLPLVGPDLESVAVRTWADVEILSLTVRRRSLPEKASPIVAGDALFNKGYFADAMQTYVDLGHDFAGSALAQKALAKAYLTAWRLPEATNGMLQGIKSEMAASYPHASYRQTILEADCLNAWRQSRYAETFALLPEIFRADPSTRIVLEMLGGEHRPLPERVGQDLLAWVARTRNVGRLDVSNLGLISLAPLKGMDLRDLVCCDNRLADLEPLRGMPLVFLDCMRNRIDDLAPLRGANLLCLRCGCNPIANLTPLHNMPLRIIRCEDCGIESLAPLEGLPLEQLWCQANKITNLDPLHGMRLTELWCYGNKISSLEPLRGMPLNVLACGDNLIVDLKPLLGAPLQKLNCYRNRITDLNSLNGMLLTSLYCYGNQITNLAPLSRSPLTLLQCYDNPIRSLDGLRGMKLQQLACQRTQITSLAPLEGMNLTRLICFDCPLTNLAPFEAKPPRQFVFDAPTLADAYVNDILDRWKPMDGGGELSRQAIIERAFRQADGATLRAMAASFMGHRYVFVWRELAWESASTMAERAGGHLLTLTSKEEHQFAWTLFPAPYLTAWLGLRKGSKKDEWVTGEPLSYEAYGTEKNRDTGRPIVLQRAASVFEHSWLAEPEGLSNVVANVIVEWDP